MQLLFHIHSLTANVVQNVNNKQTKNQMNRLCIIIIIDNNNIILHVSDRGILLSNIFMKTKTDNLFTVQINYEMFINVDNE